MSPVTATLRIAGAATKVEIKLRCLSRDDLHLRPPFDDPEVPCHAVVTGLELRNLEETFGVGSSLFAVVPRHLTEDDPHIRKRLPAAVYQASKLASTA